MSKKNNRSAWVRRAIIFSLVIGIVAGFAGCRWLDSLNDPAPAVTAPEETAPVLTDIENTDNDSENAPEEADAPEVTEEPTPEPTEEPTPEPTEAPTPEPTATPVPVKQYTVTAGFNASLLVDIPETATVTYGEAPDFSSLETQAPVGIMEVTETAEPDTIDEPEEVNTTKQTTVGIQVTRYMGPEYYSMRYGSVFELKGTEACVEIALNFAPGMDNIVSLKPQEIFDSISVVLEDDTVVVGYSLLDQEISASAISNPEIPAGSTVNVYKFFDYTPDMAAPKYLRIVMHTDGIECDYDFELGEPESGFQTVQLGDNNDSVVVLQSMLIERGFLTGVADGAFGPMTEEAVKKVQTELGMEATGVANVEFQKGLATLPISVAVRTEPETATAQTETSADTADTSNVPAKTVG